MLKRTFLKTLMAGSILMGFGLSTVHADGHASFDGPKSGPKAADGKTIVVLAGDLKNGGILGVTNGVEEAAAKIGWQVRVLDGAGSVQGRTAAFGQAMALKPDGIVINGFDAVEQQAALETVASSKIPMVSWHSGPRCAGGNFRQRIHRRNGSFRDSSAVGDERRWRQSRRCDLHRFNLSNRHRQS